MNMNRNRLNHSLCIKDRDHTSTFRQKYGRVDTGFKKNPGSDTICYEYE